MPQANNSWTAFAVIGTAEDTTDKLYVVRVLDCSDQASEKILARSYSVPGDGSEESLAQQQRYALPWGQGCGASLWTTAAYVSASPAESD